MAAEVSALSWRELLADLLETAALSPSTPTAPSPAPDGFWAQLATTRAAGQHDGRLAGRPALRTVNLRGLRGGAAARDPSVPDDRLLHFITDARSDKAADAAASPGAELLLFFPRSMCQVRLSGALRLEHGTDLVAAVWARLSNKERRYFAWPAPGRLRTTAIGSDDDMEAFAAAAPAAPPAERPACFRLGVLDVDFVEYLNLGTFPPVRTRYLSNSTGVWDATEVNP